MKTKEQIEIQRLRDLLFRTAPCGDGNPEWSLDHDRVHYAGDCTLCDYWKAADGTHICIIDGSEQRSTE